MNEPASQGDGRALASNVEDQSPISPNKATEPTSVQNLPLISSDPGSLPSLPFHVAIADGGLEIDAKLKNEADVDRLIQILQTIKPLCRVSTGDSRVSPLIHLIRPIREVVRKAFSSPR